MNESHDPPPLKKRPSTCEGPVSPPRKKIKAKSNISESAVNNFFKPSSQKQKTKSSWQEFDRGSLLVCYHRQDEFEKTLTSEAALKPCVVTAFDLDGTLITTKSGRAFPKDANDWEWWDRRVPAALRALSEKKQLIVVFTNQGWTGKNAKYAQDFKQKTSYVLENLDLPVVVYAARMKDRNRKPCTGMWEGFIGQNFGDNKDKVDYKRSVFIGDMAGRYGKGKQDSDRSCSDRDFAANIGIDFKTPEEFFQGKAAREWRRAFDPFAYTTLAVGKTEIPSFPSPPQPEMIIFCGSPGAGKSTFYFQYLAPCGYQRINQDILKSRDNCIKAARAFLKDGHSIAVDNTNASVDTRRHWTSLAKNFDLPIRCIYFTASPELARHNAAVRTLGGSLMNPENRTALPELAFSDYQKRFERPQLNEGFKQIVEIAFQVSNEGAPYVEMRLLAVKWSL